MNFFPSYQRVATIILSGSLLGCTIGTPKPISNVVTKNIASSRIVEKNYILGKQLEAYVGETIVRVKDYYLEESETLVATANANATASGLMISVNLENGRQYPVVGTWNLGGIEYSIVQASFASGPNQAGLLIREDGSIADRLLIMIGTNPNNYKALVANSAISVVPARTRLIRGKTSKVDSRRGGYINFELLFSGITGQSMNVLYREYSPDDVARTAFFQNLTYDRNASTIRFKGLRIQLHSVNNERLKFTVIEDSAL